MFTIEQDIIYATEDDSNLYKCKTETFKSFFPTATKFWNNLDESICSIESKSGLKAKLSKVIAPDPLYYYSGRRKIKITLARIYMHCSELHQHLADMHIIKNNLCACGNQKHQNIFSLLVHFIKMPDTLCRSRSLTYRLI